MSLTEEQREKIKYLSTYKNLLRELDCKIEERNSWNDRMLNISPSYSNQPRVSGVKDKISDGVAAIQDIVNNLSSDIINIKNRKEEIEQIINGVENATLRNLLTMRYINGKRWEEVAVEMNYYGGHVYRLHESALDCIDIKR